MRVPIGRVLRGTGAVVGSLSSKSVIIGCAQLETRHNQQEPSAWFLAQQSALTSRICSIVDQDVSNSLGGRHNDSKASRPRNRHVQPVGRVQELDLRADRRW
jgi:hypothetical protein